MEACKKCGAHQWFMEQRIVKSKVMYRVICKNCDHQGGWADSEDGAIALWDRMESRAN